MAVGVGVDDWNVSKFLDDIKLKHSNQDHLVPPDLEQKPELNHNINQDSEQGAGLYLIVLAFLSDILTSDGKTVQLEFPAVTVCNQNRLNCGLVQSFLESFQQKDEQGPEEKKTEDWLKRLMKFNGCSQLSTDTNDNGSQDTIGKECFLE